MNTNTIIIIIIVNKILNIFRIIITYINIYFLIKSLFIYGINSWFFFFFLLLLNDTLL